jgi:hypothetical protein
MALPSLTTSDSLPVDLDVTSNHDLMVMLGQKQEQTGSGLPTLRVNYDDENAAGVAVPRGKWTAWTDDGVQVFADTASFRIMASAYQYSHFDNDEGKMVSTSIYFQGWNEEIIDDIGTLKCGKLSKKDIDNLPPAEQKEQKKIKCARVLFGLATLAGKDADDNKVTITDLPCAFYAKGTHFMPMTGYIDDLSQDNILMPTINTTLNLDRKKNGKVTYWEVVPSRGDAQKLTKADIELVQSFSDTIRAENDAIIDKWKSAKVKLGESSKDVARDWQEPLNDVTPPSPQHLDADMDDEIPF